MRTKLLTRAIIILIILSNINIIFISIANADENQPQWPDTWILFDSDPAENGDSDDYRDVCNASYYANDSYLYFRLECYGNPNFTAEPESRYKWYIDTDDPHNMGQSGGNVFDAEYMLFIEDSPKPGGDGTGDIYLLTDLNKNGLIQDDWPDYINSPGPILDSSIAGYTIEDNYIDLYISQESISFPKYSYFTWATDQEDPNLDSAPNIDRSNSYWDADLTKADLSIIKSASINPVIAGESFVYNINVTNHGPHIAKNVTIIDTLPPDVVFNIADPSPTGSNDSIYYWNYSSLAVGESVYISINVTADTDFTGDISNFAEVDSETHDPIPGNNEDTEETEICEIFYLFTNIDGNGTIIKNPDKEFYPSGENVELTAVSDPGWSYCNWSGCISDTNNTITILMNSDKSIIAHFTQDQYILYITINGNGTIDKNPDNDNYTYGTTVLLNANPATGWKFDHWDGDLTGSDNPTTINMTENKNIIAFFTQEQYKLNITINGNGIVDKSPDYENYTYGTNVTLNADPAAGWRFDHWDGDLTGSDNPATINMTENKDITVYFVKKKNSGDNTGGGFSDPFAAVPEPNIAPVANAGGPYYGTPGEDILFNASLSYDTDGYIESWQWEFGDGANGEGLTIYYNYSTSGEYIVNLTVTDNEGASDKNTTIAIIIKPNSPPSLPEISGPIEGIVNIYYNFSFVFNDEDNDKIKYTIDWGDGNTSESDFIAAGQSFNVSHRWIKSGVYKVTVIGDDNETITTEDFEITINDPEPTDIPEQNNIWLIIILIIGLLFLLLFYLLSTGDNRKEEERDKK